MKPSTRKPIPRPWIDQTIEHVTQAMAHMEAGTPDADYRRLFGAINMAEIFVTHNGGVWRGCDLRPVQLHDPDRVIHRTMVSMGTMMRATPDGAWQIDADTTDLLREMLEALVEICETLPHSEVQKCRNIAHKRALNHKGLA